jgi:mRNA interferase MazF
MFKKGDVVVAPFPYQSDPKQGKDRPVLILAPTPVGGFICAYITKSRLDDTTPIYTTDFKDGSLNYSPSFLQSYTLFTINASQIVFKCGTLKDDKVRESIQKLVDLLLPEPKISQDPPPLIDKPILRKRF